MSRCAIISGGGNRGAYFAGWLSATQPDYKVVYGNSAGANMAISVALGLYEELAHSYATLTNDIWTSSPLNRKGGMNYIKCFWNLISKNGAGDLSGHRDYIEREINHHMWQALQDSGKHVIVATTNMNTDPITLDLWDSRVCDFGHFKDMIHASSLFWPMARPFIDQSGTAYADGGHLETLLIDQAVADGFPPDAIDVYMLRVYPVQKDAGKPKNLFDTAKRLAFGSRHSIVYEDLFRALEYGKVLPGNVHWLPYELPGNAMNFDPVGMSEMVARGRATATENIKKSIP